MGTLEERFQALWSRDSVPDVFAFLEEHRDAALEEKARVLVIDQARRRQLDVAPPVEEYFRRYPDIAVIDELKIKLVLAELEAREDRGEAVNLDDLAARFPEIRDALLRRLAEMRTQKGAGGNARGVDDRSPTPSTFGAFTTGQWSYALACIERQEEAPPSIGRFRVERRLGEGAFGKVYLAHDDQLDRLVAIKVPHPELVELLSDTQVFLAEARSLARLDHPGIVPVHEVGGGGGSGEGLYIVQKYVEGKSLAQLADEDGPLETRRVVGMIATIAETLHYVHTRGIVHRDIKPANILIDASGSPILTDFGLALRTEDFGKRSRVVGTPAYMSPEQARGEGHRVDGRSDVFSLGVVLYELITDTLPFHGDSAGEILKHIKTMEARPPRQIDETIPREVERICLKALAKRASERYSTALDMAEDLRHFLKVEEGATRAVPEFRPETVIPKILRPFEREDSSFFLELLPGPRDRNGLPDSLRFWKARVEERDVEDVFRVGLLYGPSGSGKTSFIKAGLLPLLGSHVSSVCVDAHPSGTESRLVDLVRKRCGQVDSGGGLTKLLTELRKGRGLPPGKKLFIVLDQFEQWLNAREDLWSSELVPALRQCDGRRVQCLILIRDDFWMTVTRFFRELEIRLAEGENSAALEAFDLRHARYVLGAFGQAFGALPGFPDHLTGEQERFLTDAVADLASDGNVIPIRLALFSEMIKAKPWCPATLREVGGAQGVGEKFLEKTFCSSSAPPEHRRHQKAAQSVLRCLLPPPGTDIKGHLRARSELLDASGYRGAPEEFDRLMEILETKVKFLTSVDLESRGREGGDSGQPGYYQLTHDYLIPSLRNWLTRKQGETRKGRAELQLAERVALWRSKPERKQLPTWWEWLSFRWLVRKSSWQEPERRMMREAAKLHLTRGILAALIVLIVAWGFREFTVGVRAGSLVDRLLEAKTGEVPQIVSEMVAYRSRVLPQLREAYAAYAGDDRRMLHLSLALLPFDPSQVAYLVERVWQSSPEEIRVIRDGLYSHRDRVEEEMWAKVEEDTRTRHEKLRGVCVLARLDPDDTRWRHFGEEAAGWVLSESAVLADQWGELLTSVRSFLIPSIESSFMESTDDGEREIAALVLGRYLARSLHRMVELLQSADEHQLGVLANAMGAQGSDAISFLRSELRKRNAIVFPAEARDEEAHRHANLVIALALLGDTQALWAALDRGSYPLVRTALVHRMVPCGVRPSVLIRRLEVEEQPSVLRALLLSLGEYTGGQLPEGIRAELVPKLLEMYGSHRDGGVHSATEWLLRAWGHEDRLEKGINELPVGGPADGHEWYMEVQQHTLIVVEAPVEFRMGSPETEVGRDGKHEQRRHLRQITHSFAVSTKEVTVEQVRRFDSSYQPDVRWSPDSDLPAVGPSVEFARHYCQWLSKEAGLPPDEWCYDEPAADGDRLRLRGNYRSLAGYRLPTEEEWEYVCRAGAESSRHFGESDTYLDRYEWSIANSGQRPHQVGRLKPNDFGLFDTLGNVSEWCEGPFDWDHVDPGEMPERFRGVLDGSSLYPMRGGSYLGQAARLRCSSRVPSAGIGFLQTTGFRIARSIPGDAKAPARR